MVDFLTEGTLKDEDVKAVCNGSLCPTCFSREIESTTSAPDGFCVNQSYKCIECETEWEGY